MGNSISSNNKRIAKNTFLLYLRMFLLMLISLYTSRLILKALGVEDYGIYNVVGGFVSMFSLISGSLSAAISRYLTFELGRGELDSLKKVFSSSFTIQICITLIVICLAETIGLWFLNAKMIIPEERLVAANMCYQFSIISFSLGLLSVPFNASIISHEHMSTFAFISLFEAFGKLCVVLCIAYNPIDRLVFYALMVAVISWVVNILYVWYCKRHFEECVFFLSHDRSLFKKIFSFAGWNFLGASSSILRDQGTNVLLNLFFGPLVNASMGIAMSINQAVSNFVTNFITAINPQITKQFASHNYNYTFDLVFWGAKISFFLFWAISLPIILETPMLIYIWLGVIPNHAVNFARLILSYVMVESISYTMVTLMLATGNIKKYQIIVGGCQLLILPISFLLLTFGLPPEYTFSSSIFMSFICLFLRLKMLRGMVDFPSSEFAKNVVLRIILVTVVSAIFPFIFILSIESGILRLICTSLISIFSVLLSVYFVGCNKSEKKYITQFVVDYKKRLFYACSSK